MKIKTLPAIFFYKFAILLITFAYCEPVRAQQYQNSAPVKWENYSVKNYQATFLLPKLPVVVEQPERCRGEMSVSYGSYAAGAAYVVKITRKIEVPKSCDEKREFDENRFFERVIALKTSEFALKERENGKAKSKEVVLEGRNRIHKLVNDFKNNQWFEFLVVGADETKPEVKQFLASLKINKKTKGIEIGDGAPQTLGDAVNVIPDGNSNSDGKSNGGGKTPETPATDPSSKKPVTEGVMVILKPRANYTDLARSNLTQGKVVLRVTFMKNGGTGAISVISGVPDGLTEEAIAAARRLLFIPAKRNGVAYSVTKPVEYTFTIY